MCTAISFQSGEHYFGRNLDLEYCYHEAVTVTPRNYPFHFRCHKDISTHYAMIGVATIEQGYPLYYDATNEVGLSMAGLNFSENAHYESTEKDLANIAPFELIPWVLTQCKTVEDAKFLLSNTNIIDISFSPSYPQSQLHWIISDQQKSITVEPMKDGLQLKENPIGILTNNPPFEYHIYNLNNYLSLSNKEPQNTLLPTLPLKPFSRGMGALGLPGDLSSQSRFIRAAFTKFHSVKPQGEAYAVNQFFHILHSVEQQEGCVLVHDQYEKTIYSSCCNTHHGIYYYTCYENPQISAVHMHNENLDSDSLISYPLLRVPQIRTEN